MAWSPGLHKKGEAGLPDLALVVLLVHWHSLEGSLDACLSAHAVSTFPGLPGVTACGTIKPDKFTGSLSSPTIPVPPNLQQLVYHPGQETIPDPSPHMLASHS